MRNTTSFDKHLTFSDRISLCSKSCFSHIGELSDIHSYLDSPTTSTVQAFSPLYTPNLINVALCTAV